MYRYVFNLQQRSQGLVIVTRYDQHVVCPLPGDWECVAPDNATALELARGAAFAEWPRVAGRVPNDFLVQFHDAEAPAASETPKVRTRTGVHFKPPANGVRQRQYHLGGTKK